MKAYPCWGASLLSAIIVGVSSGIVMMSVFPSRLDAAPTSVAGDAFVLVATGGTVELCCLISDAQGNVLAGNNSNGPGIPLQRFRPGAFTNAPIPFEDFGPVCNDGDGLTSSGGYLYVSDIYVGVQKVNLTNGSATVFLPNSGKNATGSPLAFRHSDGHLFVGYGYLGGPRIDEFDAAGAFVTNYTTLEEVETMTIDPASGMLYYAPYGTSVHAYNPVTKADSLIANITGTVDAGMAFDTITHRLFVGTANGSDQGLVYSIDPTTGAVALFASGFQGCLGILREQASGDLYFLEANAL